MKGNDKLNLSDDFGKTIIDLLIELNANENYRSASPYYISVLKNNLQMMLQEYLNRSLAIDEAGEQAHRYLLHVYDCISYLRNLGLQ